MTSSKMVLCICLVLLLQGCASNPHLLFFTNSSIGVDISVEQSQTPVKFIVGYKRQEGVLDPLGQGYAFEKGVFKNQSTSVINGIIQTKDGYFYPKGVKEDAHSVIAKMNFGATGGGSAETSAAQWFATGKAAEELAKNPSTPAAIAGDSKIQLSKKVNLNTGNKIRNLTILKLINKSTEEYLSDSGKSDKDAQLIKSNLDELDAGEFKTQFKKIQIVEKKLVETVYPDSVKPKSFDNVINYIEIIVASYKVAESAIANNGITVDGTNFLKDDEAKKKELLKTIDDYKNRSSLLLGVLENNENVHKLVDIYTNKILAINGN